MSSRILSGIMLLLLLIGMLTLAISIQPVRAQGTITINADGSITPSTAPIYTADDVTYTLTGNITANVDGIVIERDNIVLDGAGYTVTGSGSGIGVTLTSISGVTVRSMTLENYGEGIQLYHSSGNTLFGNNVANNMDGIYIYYSASNTLSHNLMEGNRRNFEVLGSSLSEYLQSIDTSNLVDGKPVYYFVSQSNIVVNADAYPEVGYLGFVDCVNVTVQGMNLTGNGEGLLIAFTTHSKITGNHLSNNFDGIDLFSSSGNTLSGNTVIANIENGIGLDSSSNNNVLSGNNVTANIVQGIVFAESSNNTLSDNLMENNGVNFGVVGNTLSHYLQSVDTSNLVNGKPIYYFVNRSDLIVNPKAYPEVGYLGFVDCVNVTVQGMNLTGNGEGLLIAFTTHSKITGNNFSNNQYCIDFRLSSGNTFSGNNITNNFEGIDLAWSFNNTLSGNNVANNEYGIAIFDSSYNNVFSGNNITNNWKGIDLYYTWPNNLIYHNNFVNNTIQVLTEGSTNIWNEGYPSGGNYWSDYSTRNPNATEVDSSGIWNTPYVIDANNTDHYPLMTPYGAGHDVAVTDLQTSKTVVAQGYGVSTTVTVADDGAFSEAFNMMMYVNMTAVSTQFMNLTSGTATTISFAWNTTNLVYGNYSISAYASPVQGETHTADNNFTGVVVTVTIPGDINGDFKISLPDLVLLANAYASHQSDTKWNPNADINSNGVVDLSDLVILANHYGQHYP